MPARQRPYLQRALLRDEVPIDFDRHPFDIPAVRAVGEIEFHPNVTFFVGENGSGKSTVLEAIAVALGYRPEGGHKGLDPNAEAGSTPMGGWRSSTGSGAQCRRCSRRGLRAGVPPRTPSRYRRNPLRR